MPSLYELIYNTLIKGDTYNLLVPKGAEPNPSVHYQTFHVRMTFTGDCEGKYLFFQAPTDKFFAEHEKSGFVRRNKQNPGSYKLRTTIHLEEGFYMVLDKVEYDLTLVIVDDEPVLRRMVRVQ